MNDTLVTLLQPAIPPEVREFAVEKEASHYLNAAIDLARRAFGSSAIHVSLGQDAEDERHHYIALDVDVSGSTTEELLGGQRIWSSEITRVCPSSQAVYFVLGWR
jgi:hypothetical protein